MFDSSGQSITTNCVFFLLISLQVEIHNMGATVLTLESGIDVGQGITIVGPGKFVKKNKRRALNTHIL